MSLASFAGIGTIYMAPVNSAGVLQGDYKAVGNAYPLSLQVSTSQMKVISRMIESAGQPLHVKTELEDVVGSLTLRQWDAKNLAWALSGSAAAMSGTGGSVTDEAVTAPAAGEFVKLANTDVSNVVVQDVTDTTTYVEGTDYELKDKAGLITILAAGSISEDDVLHIDYDYAAESGYEVDVGSSTLIRVSIYGHLKNEFTDEEFLLEIDSAVLATDSEINFISEEGSEGEELNFNMTLETVGSNTSPARIKGIS